MYTGMVRILCNIFKRNFMLKWKHLLERIQSGEEKTRQAWADEMYGGNLYGIDRLLKTIKKRGYPVSIVKEHGELSPGVVRFLKSRTDAIKS